MTAVSRSASLARPADGGFVVAEWTIGVALLVIPFMMLMAVIPTWAARHEAAAAAAREATRVATTVLDHGDPVQAGRNAAAQVLQDRGVSVDQAMVQVALPIGGAVREGEVRAAVALPGVTVTLPLFGDVRGPTVTAEHVRRLDPYRSRG